MSIKLELSIYYTFESGENIRLFHPSKTSAELKERADEILVTYGHLISLLSSPKSAIKPGIERLQDAFAAACGSYSPEEWGRLAPDTKASESEKYRQFLFDCQFNEALSSQGQKLPALVLHMGGLENRMAGSPSYKEALSCDAGPSDELDDWDDRWTADNITGLPLRKWGWHSRDSKSHDSHGSPFIFLCAFFVVKAILLRRKNASHVKPQLEKFAHPPPMPQIELLNTFLEVVLFHELIHATRTLMNGIKDNTPPKCIDLGTACSQMRNSEGVIQEVGEAGRLGESLAFGAVVELTMKNGEMSLFAVNTDESKTRYGIDSEITRALFGLYISLPPLSMDVLKLNPPLEPSSEGSSSKFHDDQPFEVRVKFIEPEPARIVEIKLPNRHWAPITGLLAERSKKEAWRDRLPCVIRPGWTVVMDEMNQPFL